MGLSGFLFISWRIFQMITLIPIVGMLSWFVHGYVESNQLTPTFILVLFIVSVLALAWVFFTLIGYLRARHDAFFVAFVDLLIFGALIAAVVVMRGIGGVSCSNFESADIYVDLGVFGFFGRQGSGSRWAVDINKNCAMLKASWAFAIINILTFFVTFFLALLVGRNHRDDEKVVVKREVREIHHSSRHGHRRSSSRDHRSRSRDYRPVDARRTSRAPSSRRQYYV